MRRSDPTARCGASPRRVLPCLCFAFLLFLAPHLRAGEDFAPDAVTAEKVNAEIAKIEANEAFSPDERAGALDRGRQLLALLQQRDQKRQTLRQVEAAIQAAPERLAALRQALDSPSAAAASVEPDATVRELEAQRAALQAAVDELGGELEAANQELQGRANRRTALTQQAADAARALQALGDAKLAEEGAGLSHLERWLARVRREVTGLAESAAKAELRLMDAQAEVLPLRRDLAARRKKEAEDRLKAVQDALAVRRKVEAEEASRQARATAQAAATEHPLLFRLAEENRRLAEQRTGPDGLGSRIETATLTLAALEKQNERLTADHTSLEQKVAAVGLSRAVGLLFLRKHAELPDVAALRQALRTGQESLAHTQLDLIRLEEERGTLVLLDTAAEDALAAAEAPIRPEDRPAILAAVHTLLEKRRALLDDLLHDTNTLFGHLVSIDTARRILIERSTKLARYIEENALWVQNAKPFGLSVLAQAGPAITWWGHPRQAKRLAAQLYGDLLQNPFLHLAGLLVLLMWIRLLPRLRTALQGIHALVLRGEETLYHPLEAALLCVLLAAPLPLGLCFVGWRLVAAESGETINLVTGAGLWSAGAVLLSISVLHSLSRQGGFLDIFSHADPDALGALRWRLAWLRFPMPVGAFLFYGLDLHPDSAWHESLGRLGLLLYMGAPAIASFLLLRGTGPLLGQRLQHQPTGLLSRTRHIWSTIAWGLPLLAMGLALRGYEYGAERIAHNYLATLGLAATLLLANAVLARWLFLLRRRPTRTPSAPTDRSDPEGQEAPAAQFQQLSRQTQRFLHAMVAAGLAVGLWIIWAEMLPALRALDRIALWTTTTAGIAMTVSLGDLLLGLLLLAIFILASSNLPPLVEVLVLRQLHLDRGIRFAIGALSRYSLVALGVVLAFGRIGIGWSQVQWLVAAMTVGLGFGLQEIFGNFVAGLIILIERPVRVGDTITIGDISGTVTQIRIRATTVQQWNRKELIVPNKEFITGRLTNWSLSDTVLRLDFPVGIAYGSDTGLAEKTLYAVAARNGDVLGTPPPFVLFRGFGNSSLDFELRLFIEYDERNHYLRVCHAINAEIDRAFRDAGIVIAFPQRDVHIIAETTKG